MFFHYDVFLLFIYIYIFYIFMFVTDNLLVLVLLLSCKQYENDPGTFIPEAEGQLQYQITKDAAYKFVSFSCIPVRDDGVIGEGRTTISHERVRPGLFTFLFIEEMQYANMVVPCLFIEESFPLSLV
jgi:hypothetical protein